jgi:hypothetical protein
LAGSQSRNQQGQKRHGCATQKLKATWEIYSHGFSLVFFLKMVGVGLSSDQQQAPVGAVLVNSIPACDSVEVLIWRPPETKVTSGRIASGLNQQMTRHRRFTVNTSL